MIVTHDFVRNACQAFSVAAYYVTNHSTYLAMFVLLAYILPPR